MKMGNPAWKPGRSANPARQWQPGQSGNAAGKPMRRILFERALADALAGEDVEAAAGELAEIAWKGARCGEAWAVQLLFARLAPQPMELRVGAAEPDLRGAIMAALEDQPAEVRYAVARKLFDMDGKLLESEEAPDGQTS